MLTLDFLTADSPVLRGDHLSGCGWAWPKRRDMTCQTPPPAGQWLPVGPQAEVGTCNHPKVYPGFDSHLQSRNNTQILPMSLFCCQSTLKYSPRNSQPTDLLGQNIMNPNIKIPFF
jgi:hypothetical protein